MDNHDLIDVASKWVDARKGAYLAKDNVIVYYASLTGRKSDYLWHTLSLQEVVRIIRATVMSSEDAGELRERHIIAACQELDRVYEFGIKSRFKVTANVFNYFDEALMDMGDIAVSLLVGEIFSLGYSALLVTDLEELHDTIAKRLKIHYSFTERRDLFIKHLTHMGYELRLGSLRVVFEGRKQSAIMLSGKKPRDIVYLSTEDKRRITSKIIGEIG